MPKHRGLTLRTFVSAIPWDLFQRYFRTLELEEGPSDWQLLNVEALEEFLSRPENLQAQGPILEDFRRINDICGRAMNVLVHAHRRFGLEFDNDTPRQEMAMRLFLDHREAFEFAWGRYLLYSSPARLALYRIQGPPLEIGTEEIKDFREDLRRWFGELAKGNVCEVRHFEDGDETIILVSRGSYMRTVASWEGDRITFKTFRPAAEDVLVYNRESSLLSVKAGLAKDREKYLQAFGTHLAGDDRVAESAAQDQIFNLAPIQDGRFDFVGEAPITAIQLLKVRLRLHGVGHPVLEVKSDDLMWTFGRELEGVSLESGDLTMARFRFHIRPEGERPAKVTFEIEPPARTDLAQKRHADLIERYLVNQGVKLL